MGLAVVSKNELLTILLHQRACGGWPKNYKRNIVLTDDVIEQLRADGVKSDATIDNGATHEELVILAEAYGRIGDERYRKSFLRGVRYLLDGQYENGGWPQFFPNGRGYSTHITFNDGAMIGVMGLLDDIAAEKKPYRFVGDGVRNECRTAVEHGIECILKCQIRTKGKRTVWCAQHDEHTFEPRKARSYELASFSGSESVGIVRFLMSIDAPSDEIVESIPQNNLLWEAPQKHQQVWFIKEFGPNVNLGNISSRDVVPLETLRLGLRGDTLSFFHCENG